MQEWYVVVETILHLFSDADLSPPNRMTILRVRLPWCSQVVDFLLIVR